jgi:pilus assembly protein FimV
MPAHNRPAPISFALKTLASAVACAVLLSPAANAAGLGKLTVLSSLGQALRAEIELTSVSNDEAGNLVAKLAPADAFRVANIEFNPALLSLRFAVEQRSGRQFIKISSSQPVNEPFVDMLLELSWASGRLVREYTFLLDPAELRQTQPVQVVAAAAAPGRAAPFAQRNRAPAGAARSSASERSARQAPASGDAGYKVKPGETLSRIAARLKPADVSLDLMLLALYRANPDAFDGKNMNRLRSGQILTVPDAAAVQTAASHGEAHGTIVAHAADFNAYRNKLAGQVASAAPTRTPEATRSAAGKITAKVEERATPANASKDQLKLSKAAPAAGAAGQAATASVEDQIAKDRQIAEATARVKELEQNISNLEQQMQEKNRALAEQSRIAAALAPAPTGAKPEPLATGAKPEPVATGAQPSPRAAVAKAAPRVVAPTSAPIVPAAEPSLMDTVFDNIVPIGAALAALLAGIGVLLALRRKRKAPVADSSILGEPSLQVHSLFAGSGGQSVDTNNSVFNSNFAPTASQLDTNEVDPVAEADVYIAYGRDAQAEEILKEALRTHPGRDPVRLKLLEIYATRKDARAFETQAGELYSMTKGQGNEWAQATALGRSIDPLNPLYAGTDAGALSASAASSAPPEPQSYAPDAQSLLAQQLDDAFSLPDSASSTVVDLDLDLNPVPEQARALPEPVAAAPLPKPAAPVPAATDSNTLDFDLGGLTFEPIAPADTAPIRSAAQHPSAPAKPDPAFDLSFDMDFDLPSPGGPKAQPGSTSVAGATPASAAPALADLLRDQDALEIDFPALPMAAAGSGSDTGSDAGSDAANFPAVIPASELTLDDFFAIPQATASAGAAPAGASLSNPSTLAQEFDLSGIDLDLDPTPAPSLKLSKAGETASGTASGTAPEGELSALHMEMDTKLDLAIAYREIGDKEGARELIDEVIKGGSAAQVVKANAMRAKLG